MIHFYMASSTLLCPQQSGFAIWNNYLAERKLLQHWHYCFPYTGMSSNIRAVFTLYRHVHAWKVLGRPCSRYKEHMLLFIWIYLGLGLWNFWHNCKRLWLDIVDFMKRRKFMLGGGEYSIILPSRLLPLVEVSVSGLPFSPIVNSVQY